MDPIKTGALIAERRKEMQMTQQELADKIGVTNKAISRWETGRGYPDVELIPMIAKELSLSVNDLLSGEKTEQKKSTQKSKLFLVIIIILSFLISALFTYAIRLTNINNPNYVVYLEKYIFLYISLFFFLLSATIWNTKYFLIYSLSFVYTSIEFFKLSILPFSIIQIPSIITDLAQFIPPIIFFLMLYRRKGKNK